MHESCKALMLIYMLRQSFQYLEICLLCEEVISFFAFNRFILSLTSNRNCMVIDDQLNILPISSHTLSITALPPKSKVKIIIPVF